MFPKVQFVQVSRQILKRFHSTDEISGSFQYTKLTNKSYIKIWGPDTIKFLNGMITSKLQPHFIKKNLMTINDQDKSQLDGGSIINFPLDKSNWGLYQEESTHGEYISKFGQYTGVLNGKGKLVTGSILYSTREKLQYPQFLIEFDKGMISHMIEDFESHKLGSKLKFNVEEDIHCWDIMIKFHNMPSSVENPWIDNLIDPMTQMVTREDADSFFSNVIGTLFSKNESLIKSCFVDTRFNKLIFANSNEPIRLRVLTTKHCKDIGEIYNDKMMPFPIEIQRYEDNSVVFRKDRLKYGFIDGVSEVKPNSLLPLECNFDYMPNVISDNKGCYVGQELTARTISTGILRKRLVGVALDIPPGVHLNSLQSRNGECIDVELDEKYDMVKSNMAPNPFAKGNNNTSTIKKRKKPVGSLIANQDETGVVLLRTDYFPLAFNEKFKDARDKFYIMTPDGDRINVIPRRPIWYEEWAESQTKR